VPAFRGLEPRLALGYSSQGGSGFAGVGWVLGGFSVIERLGAGLGAPAFDSTDVYVLDGRELIACQAGNQSPSCTTQAGQAGAFTTKDESYIRINRSADGNTWTVWQRDGTRMVLSRVYPTSGSIVTWGQSSVVDTRNNTVTYAWEADGTLDTYPRLVTFGPYSVTIYREVRPDVTTSGVGSGLRQTRHRIRTILVKHSTEGNIRAYRLQYTVSGATGRSLLTSVQQYGRDVVVDGQGGITTGPTTLPARTFLYREDTAARSFVPQPAQ
jgi:hypothetical protein